MKRVSLIVPVYNALKYVKLCIKSILANFNFELGEVIIIDDHSDSATENYLKFIADLYPERISLIRNEHNLGYLRSCNKAVVHAAGEIVIFLNSDCEIPDLFVERILACFCSDENIIAASPIASNGASYFIPQLFTFKYMSSCIQNRRPDYPEIYNAEGFCFCVRKCFIDNYGLFDEIYGVGYCEELDYSFLIRKKGFKCVLIDNLYVKHARNKSFKKKKYFQLAKNNAILYEKWKDVINTSELLNLKNPIKEIIKETFTGLRGLLLLYTIKCQKFFVAGRFKTLLNLRKCYKKTDIQGKNIIYTCITGNSDIIPVIHEYYSKDWNYVCFTDNKKLCNLKYFGMWKILPLAFCRLDDTRNARWHKTHPHILFPNAEKTIWIDANINVLTSYLFDIIEHSESEMLVPLHYCRNCVYDEIAAVRVHMKDDENVVFKTERSLKSEGIPRQYGLNETNIVYSSIDSVKCTGIFEQWWFMIENYSKRDQLSFSYVLWKNNIPVSKISIPNVRTDLKNYAIYSHNNSGSVKDKLLKLIFK